jgi:hypothetical protein
MGTNYYLHSPVCECCGRSDEPLHIGKSSAGWCFSLHVIPERGLNTLDDWKELWAIRANQGQLKIVDEYERTLTADEMTKIITERKADESGAVPFGYSSWHSFHYANCSEWGPNNLLRQRLGHSCVGHGEGTWDYIDGEFS